VLNIQSYAEPTDAVAASDEENFLNITMKTLR
jgi:hypothetical protein